MVNAFVEKYGEEAFWYLWSGMMGGAVALNIDAVVDSDRFRFRGGRTERFMRKLNVFCAGFGIGVLTNRAFSPSTTVWAVVGDLPKKGGN